MTYIRMLLMMDDRLEGVRTMMNPKQMMTMPASFIPENVTSF